MTSACVPGLWHCRCRTCHFSVFVPQKGMSSEGHCWTSHRLKDVHLHWGPGLAQVGWGSTGVSGCLCSKAQGSRRIRAAGAVFTPAKCPSLFLQTRNARGGPRTTCCPRGWSGALVSRPLCGVRGRARGKPASPGPHRLYSIFPPHAPYAPAQLGHRLCRRPPAGHVASTPLPPTQDQ